MTGWSGKHLVIVGAARQGLALAKYLSGKGVEITLTDQKDQTALESVVGMFQEGEINWALGGHPLELLDSADGIALSGGVPLEIPFIQAAIAREIPLTNDSQIFLELAPCPVIGITGSAGKTTTTLLVGKIAAAGLGQERTWVGGNIGNPLISDLDHIKADHLAVVELSSFQTELMELSPRIACVLNITPNHLDRHGTMEAYTRAKARILAHQGPGDTCVLNRDDPGSWSLRNQVKGELVSFGRAKPAAGEQGTFLDEDWICWWDGTRSIRLVPLESIKLRGDHNRQNVLAACAAAAAAGLQKEAMREGVEALANVEHRLELVRTWRGIAWVNDSKATTPQGSLAAVRSFEEPIILLAGGRDKNLPWDAFSRLVNKRVKGLVLFGEAADLIQESVQAYGEEGTSSVPYWKTSGLEEAVKVASQVAESGDVVLLSPGGTSFDEFSDFEERGRMYKKWVSELK